jgi:hypothetical protein
MEILESDLTVRCNQDRFCETCTDLVFTAFVAPKQASAIGTREAEHFGRSIEREVVLLAPGP